MLEPCNMLADVIANVGLLLVELIIVLMLRITIVVTDVMSLGAKVLCGYLLIWFMVFLNQCVCDRCCGSEAKML